MLRLTGAEPGAVLCSCAFAVRADDDVPIGAKVRARACTTARVVCLHVPALALPAAGRSLGVPSLGCLGSSVPQQGAAWHA